MNYRFLKQHTLRREVWGTGLGLHSGNMVSMKFKPAPANFGVRFCRNDLPGHPVIVARPHSVVDTLLATTIGFDGAMVSTVEHLMAAFLGKGIDNVLVELDGSEVPIFDGSADTYLALLDKAGVTEQRPARSFLKIETQILVKEGDAYIKARPSDWFSVRYVIDFPHPLIGKQDFSWSFNETTFGREIARARTFGFLRDVKRLQSMGLAQGGSLANAIVFDDSGVLNHDGFRYTDECVRHKILDFMGDLALAGMPLIGHFEAYKAGHSLHNQFLKQLVTRTESYAVLPHGFLAPSFLQSHPIAALHEPFSQTAKAF